ncbi:MAG: hypothetical protein JW940_18375 [Polyangiaceae bacterium]|nr:hypothetical protein [Polyangiaceae bacterium]
MKESEHATITVIELERMNLLGLMLRSLLGRRLGDRSARRHFEALSGPVEVEAGAMQITLGFERSRLEIRRGKASARPLARIRGTLIAVLDAALGRGLLRHVLRGELSARGGPLVLWHLLALMRVPQAPARQRLQ